MTVVVTNDHTEWFDWDAAGTPNFDGTVWGSGDGISTIFFIEGTGSLNAQNKGTGRGGAGHSKGATTVSGHIHLWINSLDIPNTQANGGWAIRISSSTSWNANYGSWNAGGSDTSRLRINGFIPFVANSLAAYDRSASPPALTAVTVIWAETDATTNSGQKTVFLDRVFFGTHSRFRGGTTAGASGNSATAAGETPAIPVFIDVGGVYYVLDGLEIGDDTSATTQFWDDANETWVFADFPNLATDFYKVEFRGHATGTHDRNFGVKSGTGIDATGSGGNTFVAGGAAPFHFIISDTNVDVAGMYGCVFNNAGHEDGTFVLDLPVAEVIGCQFAAMGQITIGGGAQFTRNGVADSVTAAAGLEQAAVNLGTTKPGADEFRFVTISGASRYGLRIEGSSTTGDSWDLEDIVIANSGTADVLVDYPAQTGGNKVTINLTGTSSLESATQVAVTGGIALADVVINNAVAVTLASVTYGTPVKIIANETVGTVTTGDVLATGFADSDGEFTFNQNYEGAFNPSGLDVRIIARNQGVAVAVIADDGGVFVNETDEAHSNATGDMTLTPAAPAVNDAYYFGHNEQFARLKVDVSRIWVGTSLVVLWEYWNGSSWGSLSATDGTNSFGILGENIVSYTIPGNWATTSVSGHTGALFYVRARVTTATGITTSPQGRKATLDVSRYLGYDELRVIFSTGLLDNASWALDTISKFDPND